MALRLIRNVRSLQRLRTIAQVLTRHGFGHLVEMIDLSRLVPLWMRPGRRQDAQHEVHRIGERLARVANDLGPTFVKLGQMLSTRPDLLPQHIIEDLRQLQDRVEPFPAEEARAIVETDLGQAVGEAFRSFEDQPFASGSIAQVHRAVTRDGQAVVVKVQRPGIAAIIRNDMHILIALAEALENYVPELKLYHPSQIFEAFHRSIMGELDFVNEASSTARFHRYYHDGTSLRIPAVRWELTGTQVLTLEWIDGTPLHRVVDGSASGFDRQALAERLAALFLRQFFETGLFHADPHPGNVLISPPDGIGLIDFGVVGQVSEDHMTQLLVALLGAVNRQTDWVVDVVAEVGHIGGETDLASLKLDLQTLLDKYHGLPLKRMDLSTMFGEIVDVVRHHEVMLPSNFVLMAKSLAMAGGTVLQLDPEMDLIALVRPRLKHLVWRRISPQHLAQTAGLSLWHLLNIAKNAPGHLRQVIRHMTRGQWQVNLQHQNLDRLARELDRSSNRLALALIIASTIIGSSMMLAMEGSDSLNLTGFAIAGYVISGVMGLGLVWAILRSGRLY